MSKPIKSNEFFEERSEQSSVKAEIVSKYFRPWAKIILSAQARNNKPLKIAYIDLFSGPGKYADGSYSTPLLVVNEALLHNDIRDALVCIFNDADGNNIEALKANLESFPNSDKLKYKPEFFNEVIKDGKVFEGVNLIPTLLFADPWGYTGLSLELLGSVLQQWGCECIFFFNYNRINAGLTNPSVKERMDAIFGATRADMLRKVLTPLSPVEREKKIVSEMESALKDQGAGYVLAYPFKKSSGKSTSHYIFFATKHKKAYDIMKDIMGKLGKEVVSGFSLLEHDPSKQMAMIFDDPIEMLGKDLLVEFSGETISTLDVFDRHSVGKPYRLQNYKKALLLLEAEALISAVPPASDRAPNTFGDNVLITFP